MGNHILGHVSGKVECPDHRTLKEIIQETLEMQLGPSLVLFYHAAILYPKSTFPSLAELDESILEYMLEREPGAFVGIYKGKCVLIAYTSTEDVRRASMWTRSSDLTRNIVTKAKRSC